jgi:hypothetical protein
VHQLSDEAMMPDQVETEPNQKADVRTARHPCRAIENVQEDGEGKAQVRCQRSGVDPAAFENRVHIHVKVAQETRELDKRSDPLRFYAAHDIDKGVLSSKEK